MKILNGSNLGFVGEFALGVIIAWLVAAPQQTAGERLRGNCQPAPMGCITETFITCSSKTGSEYCDSEALQCVNVPYGEGTCYKGGASPCMSNLNCQATWHEACVGG